MASSSRLLSPWLPVTMTLLLSVIIPGMRSHKDTHDYRTITFQDLRVFPDTRVYQNAQVQDISEIAQDGDHLLLGAKNYLVRLNLNTLNEVESVSWQPNTVTIQSCIAKGQTRSNCQNYVRVLMIKNNRVFTCGTNAFSPECTWRQLNRLSQVTSRVQGVGRCPHDPRQNSTALMLDNGDYYSATTTDFLGRDPAIYRIMGPSKPLRTVQHNNRWLNDPDFVSSYETDEYIYFFFRETAVEILNCEAGVYSRVARLCKNDQGGNFLLEDNWTTFMKARLNCSLPGAYPFSFNEIQNTYYDQRDGSFYVVFTTPASSIYGSAVCKYNANALDRAFQGPFKYQENAQTSWKRVSNNLPQSQCGASAKRSLTKNATPAQRVLMDAQKYQIMYNAVQPMGGKPYLVAEDQRFTHIAVDKARTKDHGFLDVVFLATLEGTIKKMVQIPGMKRPCKVEEIHVRRDGEGEGPIRSMELLRREGILLVSTGNRVVKLALQRCSRFDTKMKCMSARDPYCGWNGVTRRCGQYPHRSLPDWHQDLTSCPQLKFPVDGGWSGWSKWETCHHTGRYGDSCKCRHRQCDSPAPQIGGRDCNGQSVEVTECTVNGGWTMWSEWSGCSPTCGSAQKFRKRSCTNPRPAHGGRVCVGPETSVERCRIVPCPVPADRRARWGQWGAWSHCTHRCGGGMQGRSRHCDRPQIQGPRDPDNDCIGNDQEWIGCNRKACTEVRQSSDWTAWVKSNMSREGHIETRYQSVCVAGVEGAHQMRSRMKTKIRFCPAGENHCHDDQDGNNDHPDPVCSWVPWSGWSACDSPCGGGLQIRERLCVHGEGRGVCSQSRCEGQNRETRQCHVHSCQGVWLCWSDWSSCSTSCGSGRRFRMRECQAEVLGFSYTEGCQGNNREDYSCSMPTCEIGWGEWSLWSVCNHDNLQYRKRGCDLNSPFQECQGISEETRMCTYNTIDTLAPPKTEEVRDSSGSGIQFEVYYLVIVGILSFILGGIFWVGVLLFCQRRRQQSRKRDIDAKYAALQRLKAESEVKANHYVSPADLDIHIPPATLNHKYYSTGSLKRKESYNKMTVKEATLKRNTLLRNNSHNSNNGGNHSNNSMLRTSTTFDHMDYGDF